ncbi:hypothetical protein DL89DRAFT_257931 [Linderina pennispora]|uniref:Uncharacterized protein n=1 Tax=Linderina pennispora TaxID=61395 RepID=A0A1Y1W8X8_9FUNG|nr:uncharacterized protein DL89DRAFT_257931 [Linderina pennispora]ORX69706.1 hypothetical protein DL89DRAFT_257931 [Linderina pennispora]
MWIYITAEKTAAWLRGKLHLAFYVRIPRPDYYELYTFFSLLPSPLFIISFLLCYFSQPYISHLVLQIYNTDTADTAAEELLGSNDRHLGTNDGSAQSATATIATTNAIIITIIEQLIAKVMATELDRSTSSTNATTVTNAAGGDCVAQKCPFMNLWAVCGRALAVLVTTSAADSHAH